MITIGGTIMTIDGVEVGEAVPLTGLGDVDSASFECSFQFESDGFELLMSELPPQRIDYIVPEDQEVPRFKKTDNLSLCFDGVDVPVRYIKRRKNVITFEVIDE